MRSLQPRINKIDTNIHTDVLNSHTEYDVNGYLLPVSSYRSSKNGRKCRLRRLRMEFVENGLYLVPGPPNFACLSATIGLTNLPDMMSLAASSRQQNAIKYCTKMRKTAPAAYFGVDIVFEIPYLWLTVF